MPVSSLDGNSSGIYDPILFFPDLLVLAVVCSVRSGPNITGSTVVNAVMVQPEFQGFKQN